MKIAVFAVVAVLCSNVGWTGEVYKINIMRKAQDLYWVQGQNVYIKTAYCYNFSIGEAILYLTTQPFAGSIAVGRLIFTSDWQTCQVDTILR